MNVGLFLSRHGIFAAVVVLALALWPALGGFESGPRTEGGRTHLLVTGWLAAAAMLVATAYVARKYAHKRGWSHELRLRVPAAAIERAESRIGDLRRRLATDGHARVAEIEDAARTILVEEGVHRIVRAHVYADLDAAHGRGAPRIELEPTEPLGRMATWLHAHLWWGVAAAALVWLHARGAMASPLGIALEALTLVVTVTGLVGIVLFAAGPRRLVRAERRIGFEEGFVLSSSLDEKLDELAGKLADHPEAAARLRQARRPRGGAVDGLDELARLEPDAAPLLRDAMVLIAQRRRVRAELARLSSVRLAMNAWRLVHVPASIALMAGVLLHVLQVWWY